MAAAVKSPSQLCTSAEEALLLSDFSRAEAYARRCLGSRSIAASIQERALIVALQALCEQDRASAARLLLSDCYPRLEDVPPNALLLWLALAVDSEHAEEAKQAMPALLSSCQPGSAGGWSRAQYLSLIHLYVFEVLLPERRDAAEVARWVQTTDLPVTAEERQLLLDELAAQQAAQQRSEAGLTPPSGPEVPHAIATAGASGAAADSRSAGMPAGGSRPARPAAPDRVPAAAQTATGAATAAVSAGLTGPVTHKPHRQRQQPEPEIVPAPEALITASGSGSGDPASTVQAGVEWLCQAQQQAVQAAAALVRPLLGRPPADKQGGHSTLAAAHFSPDPVQLAGGTVLGAVLLYALYAERQSIRRGARRTRQAVVSGAAQLLHMAFSLSINPATSSLRP